MTPLLSANHPICFLFSSPLLSSILFSPIYHITSLCFKDSHQHQHYGMEWTLPCNDITIYHIWIASSVRHCSAAKNWLIPFIIALAYSQRSIPLSTFNSSISWTFQRNIDLHATPLLLLAFSSLLFLSDSSLTNAKRQFLPSIAPVDSLSHASIDSNHHFTVHFTLSSTSTTTSTSYHFFYCNVQHILPVYDAIIMQVAETPQDLSSVVPHCAHFKGSEMLQ